MSKPYTPAQRAAYGRKMRAIRASASTPASTYKRRAVVKYAPKAMTKTTKRAAPKKKYGKRLGKVVGEGLEDLWNAMDPISMFKKYMGLGEYKSPSWQVKSNSILDEGYGPPIVANAKDGRVILRHREYLGDVITGAAGEYNVTNYDINPGLSRSFPWGANVGGAFEEYQMKGMIFEFKSTSADALNSTNTALGSVIMATQYDVEDSPFDNKKDMENHQYAMSAKQSQSMLHPIECDPSQSVLTELYVRTNEIPATSKADSRLYDFARFSIATDGQQGDNVNIGELWCTYEIQLLKPQLKNATNDNIAAAFYQNDTGLSTVRPFGDPAFMEGSSLNSSSLDMTFETNGAYSVSFPSGTQGTFFVYYVANTTTAQDWTTNGVWSAGGGSIVVDNTVGPTSWSTPFSGELSVRHTAGAFCQCDGDVSGTPPTLMMLQAGQASAATYINVYVCRVPEMPGSSIGPLALSTEAYKQFEADAQRKLFKEYMLSNNYSTPIPQTPAIKAKQSPTFAEHNELHEWEKDLSPDTQKRLHEYLSQR